MEKDKMTAGGDRLNAEKEPVEKELLSLVQSKNQDMVDAVNKAQRRIRIVSGSALCYTLI